MEINSTPIYDGTSGNFGFSIVKRYILEGLEAKGIRIVYDDSEVCPISFSINAPGCFKRLAKDQKLIVYSMFETTVLPAHMIQSLYGCDLIITPSEHNKKMMLDSGITDVPIHVIPMGIDPTIFRFAEHDPEKEPFFFMWNGALSIRKGYLRCIEAFNDLDLPNGRLIIKTTPNPKKGAMNLTKIHDKNVYLVNGKISAERLARLYQKTGCFLFPSQGEGDIGLPPIEAMACGTPAALVSWLFRGSDYPPHYLPIDSTEEEAEFFTSYWGYCGAYAHPSMDSLKEQMVFAYENRAEIFNQARLMSEWIHQNRTWDHTINAIYEVLQNA